MGEAKLPIGEDILGEALSRDFVILEDLPFGEASLGYSLLIPRFFEALAGPPLPGLDARGLKPLSFFGGRDREGIVVQICARILRREITAAHWLRCLAMAVDYTIDATDEISERFADALISFKNGTAPFRGRLAAWIHDNRLFVMLAGVSVRHYERHAETLGLLVSSFKSTMPARRPSIERHARTRVATCELEFPSSWRSREIRHAPRGKFVTEFHHVGDDNTILGVARFKVVSSQVGSDIAVAVNDVHGELREAGATLGSLIHETSLLHRNPRFTGGTLQIHSASIGDSVGEHEVWMYSCNDNANLIVATLLSPSRAVEFESWAINKRFFEILLASMR